MLSARGSGLKINSMEWERNTGLMEQYSEVYFIEGPKRKVNFSGPIVVHIRENSLIISLREKGFLCGKITGCIEESGKTT